MDGYIGWPLALHLAASGVDVSGIDNFSRRNNVEEVGSWSAIPIAAINRRVKVANELYNDRISFAHGDLLDYNFISGILKTSRPDTIVHLGEQPSAPFSMIDVSHAVYTQHNNVIGTLNLLFAMKEYAPQAHLLKLGCYSEDTEVLTKAGWKHFFELSYEDEVCCLNQISEKIEYSKPTNIVAYQHKGRMLHIQTSNADYLITPNHRVAYRSGWRPEIKIETAEERYSKNFLIPKTGLWDSPDVEFFELPSMEVRGQWGHSRQVQAQVFNMDRWLNFLGWWIAEGSIRRRNGLPTEVMVYQSVDKHVAEVQSAISEADLHATRSDVADKRRPETVIAGFSIANNQLAAYLSELGLGSERHIPALFKNVSKRQLSILFRVLMLGDGHVNKKTGSMTYHSKSLRLLGDVQEIALKLGYGATICKRVRKRGIRAGQVDYYLSISRTANAVISSESQKWEEYDGIVYCCTVPSGIIMVRRNGKAGFSGNTMGEYGTPPTDIPEGFFEMEFNGKRAKMMFPKQPGSFYHASKVHDTHNIVLACKLWGLRSTDVMQGVVYGTRTNEMNVSQSPEFATRFDFDEVFGTVINRYCAEAVIGHDLSVYGKGGQTRGFIALVDSIQCLTLACRNPPNEGEYRVFNQLDGTYSVSKLAELVQRVALESGLSSKIRHVENPRQESEEHYYKVEARHLRDLGFKPTRTMYEELKLMLDDLMMFKERIRKAESAIEQNITWKRGRTPVVTQKA
jgi:nucleoside-diphosphate-sugar epimerase